MDARLLMNVLFVEAQFCKAWVTLPSRNIGPLKMWQITNGVLDLASDKPFPPTLLQDQDECIKIWTQKLIWLRRNCLEVTRDHDAKRHVNFVHTSTNLQYTQCLKLFIRYTQRGHSMEDLLVWYIGKMIPNLVNQLLTTNNFFQMNKEKGSIMNANNRLKLCIDQYKLWSVMDL